MIDEIWAREYGDLPERPALRFTNRRSELLEPQFSTEEITAITRMIEAGLDIMYAHDETGVPQLLSAIAYHADQAGVTLTAIATSAHAASTVCLTAQNEGMRLLEILAGEVSYGGSVVFSQPPGYLHERLRDLLFLPDSQGAIWHLQTRVGR